MCCREGRDVLKYFKSNHVPQPVSLVNSVKSPVKYIYFFFIMTPDSEQTPLQCIGLPCWRSYSLSDSLYHSLRKTTQVCRVPSRSHTCRFHRSGRRCHMMPSPWERRSFLRGMPQGGAVIREWDRETRSGWASVARPAGLAPRPPWSCTVSVQLGSLGETHTCVKPESSCLPVCPCQGGPRSGRNTAGNWRTREKRGEWLSYAKSTSQYSLAFSLKVRDDLGFPVNPLCCHDISRSDRQTGNKRYL